MSRAGRVMACILLLSLLLSIWAPSIKGDWAHNFVVFDGGVYVVTEESIERSQLGERIGEVTLYSDHEGTYGGHFSNLYPVGTPYYSIIGTDVLEAIAVPSKDGTYYVHTYHGAYAGKDSHDARLDSTDKPSSKSKQGDTALIGLLISFSIIILAVLIEWYRQKRNQRIK